MRAFITLSRAPTTRAMVQAGFFIATFVGLLFFVDRLGATQPGKYVRTGVQVPSGAKIRP